MADDEKGGTEEGEAKEGGEAKEEEAPKGTLSETIARAREVLAGKGTLADMIPKAEGEEKAGDAKEEESGEEGEGGKEGEKEEEHEEKEGEAGEAGEEAEGGEGDKEGEEKEEVEDAEGEAEGASDDKEEVDEKDKAKEAITVSVPGRHPDDEDIEIEVDDTELAERIAHLKSGFLNGEQVRQRMGELDASEDAMEELSESFETDPAGFLMEYVEEKDLPAVVLALLTQKPIWDALADTVDKLFTDNAELRTVQAESKAARLEAKSKLEKRILERKAHQKNGKELHAALDLIIPEEMKEATAKQLMVDLTRDIEDHISRNKLGSLAVKDLVPILAGRLENAGIDPLEARKAIQNGSRSRAKVTTKKGPNKKTKSGSELAKASAKRKSVAAAPGPGKKAAPTQPTKLPAGQNLKERIAAAKKHGIAALIGRT